MGATQPHLEDMMGLGGLGMTEIILIFLVVLLLFGAKRLPEIGSSLGKGIREFKSSVRDIEREIKAPGENRSLHTPPPSGPGARADDSETHAEPRRLTTSPGGDENQQ